MADIFIYMSRNATFFVPIFDFMASRIQGITVEIGGNTTKLQNALKDVNGQIKSTQSQLKDVNKLLKLDPGNTELLAQKHKLLAEAASETKEKLATLKTAAGQDYITNHFYTCSDKILCGLGRMYAGGGELTENIDDVGGVGTAEFASKAIDIFYMSRR